MKRSVKRYLAMLLVMAMVLQQGSAMGALAGETEPASETVTEKMTETQASEEEPKQTAEVKEPETKAPETRVEETKTSESTQEEPKAPETKPEESKTAESKTPETKPDETNATDATDGQTGAQEDEIPAESESDAEKATEQDTESEAVTEAPAETTESVSEPETEEETKAGKETEAESGKETEAGPTLLKAECNGVGVSVSAAPGVLKAGTTLEMVPTGKNQVYQAVLPLMDENTEIDKSNFLAYDITLKLDGEEVQPDGEVTVSFTNVPFTAGENEEIIVAHLTDAPAENSAASTISAFRAMPGASTVELASGSSMKTTHFSLFALFKAHKEALEKQLESETNDQKKQELNQAIEKFGKHGEPLQNDTYVPKNSNQLPYKDDKGEDQLLNSPAFDFHVFSEEADLGSVHTNGNVATNKFKGGTNFGNNQAKAEGIEEFNYVGESAEGFHMTDGSDNVKTVVGSGFGNSTDDKKDNDIEWYDNEGTFSLGNNGTKLDDSAKGNVYQENPDDKFINVTEELNKLSKASKELAQQKTSSGVTTYKSEQDKDHAKITVSGGERVQYLNIKATDLAGYKWTIEIDPYTTLIINVNMCGATADTLAAFNASVAGWNNSEENVRSTCNILWNLYYQEEKGEVKTFAPQSPTDTDYTKFATSGDFMGTILAPDANIEYGPVNGSIIARKTYHSGGESHSSTFTGFSVFLNLTKTYLGQNENEEKTFWFALFDKTGTTRVPGQYLKSIKVKSGQSGSVQFANLPAGTYTVYETDEKGNKLESGSGYTITGNGQVVDFTAKTDQSVTIVNDEGKEFGALEIRKNVTINGGQTSSTKLDGTYKFLVKKADGTFVREIYISIKNGKSNTVKVDGLEPGEYTVSEVEDYNKNGATLTGRNDIKVTVTANNTEGIQTAEFTNNIGDNLGSLEVKKVIAGALEAGDLTKEQKEAIHFKVTGPDGFSKEFTYADMTNGEKTFEELQPGEYTVTETIGTVEGYTLTTTYDVEGGKATVKAGETAKVTVTNTYTGEEGTLRVKKSFTGARLTDEQKAKITFTVTGPEDFGTKTFTYANMTNGVKTFTGLDEGEYTVTETNANVEGYSVTTTYSVTAGTTTETDSKVTLEEGGVAQVTVTNDYTKDTSIALRAKKEYNLTLAPEAFEFTLVEVKEGEEISETLQTKKNGADGSVSFDPISYTEAGTYTYQIKESKGTLEGVTYDEAVYLVTVRVTRNPAGTLEAKVVSIEKDGEAASEVVFTNKGATTEFSLDVAKKMKGETTPEEGKYEFELTGTGLTKALTAKNDAKGKVDFGKFANYTRDDIGKQFTYTIKETAGAADGTIYDKSVYTVTVTVSFDETKGELKAEKVIKKDGVTVSAIEFTNDVTRLSILKVDESGNALAGAKLLIKDASGKAVHGPWVTDGKAHDITGLPQGDYVLSEIEAPNGYDVAPDKKFTITDANGSENPYKVEMTDKKTPESNQNALTITKYVRVQGITSDIGVKDATFYVALFSDEARTKRVSSVKKIEFKNTTASSVTFDKLAAGTYYVSETDENGTPINTGMMGGKVFRPEYPGSMQFTFEGRADTKVGEFTNVFREFPDNFYLAGQLTVTKKVLLNGEEGTSNDTFYARVFKDAGLTTPVDDQIMVLSMAGGSTTSATVTNLPIGDTPGSSMTYYVAETDVNGIPLDPSAVEFEISVDKSEIVLSGANPNGEVVITNSFTEEEESEFESEFESEEESETEVEKKTAPKTGDDTDYMRYLLLMAFSAGLCGVAIGQKRRKAKRVRK